MASHFVYSEIFLIILLGISIFDVRLPPVGLPQWDCPSGTAPVQTTLTTY